MSPIKRVAVEGQQKVTTNDGPTVKKKQKSTATTVLEKTTPKKVIEASNEEAAAAMKRPAKGKEKAKKDDLKKALASKVEVAVKSPAKRKGNATKKEVVVDVSESIAAEVEALADATAADGSQDADLSSPRKKKKATKKAPDADDDDNTPKSLSAPPPGGSKMDTLASSELPKNMTIDDPLVLDNAPKKPGTTRIMSWNILSLKSSLAKGFTRYLDAEQADVVILTETKCNDVPLMPALTATYPYQTWGIGKTKGYAGIALLSKTKPIKVTVGLVGWDEYDTKGRIITAEYERYFVIGTYVVNAGEGLKTLPQKQEWNNRLAQHLAKCDAQKPAIWTGDLNVVLDARDLSNASKKWNKSAGYTEIECEHHRRVLNGTASKGAQPYVDIWRELHPDAVGHYTYYGFRGFCRSKGIGWRLDSFIIPKRIADQVEACEIRHTIYGASDHIPVYMDIKGTL